MTAPEREALVKALRDDVLYTGHAPSTRRLLTAAADMIEALSPAVTVTEEMVERASKAACKSGRFETGEGTCALRCMDQLGSAREKCCHIASIHGALVRSILQAALKSPTPQTAGREE